MDDEEKEHEPHLAAIDFSLVSPAICLYLINQEKFILNNCKFHVISNREILNTCSFSVTVHPQLEFKNHIDRIKVMSDWVLDQLCSVNVEHVFIEGYAYRSVGMIFNIAEVMGAIKYKIISEIDAKIITIAPSTIKRFATKSGRADKFGMEYAFIKETEINPRSCIKQAEKGWNPSSDIVDAYFLAKYGFNELKENLNEK